MPFGLVGSPSVFQRTMNGVLYDAGFEYAVVYMDDILIPNETVAEGLEGFEEVLKLLEHGGLTLGLGKCHFCSWTLSSFWALR